MEQGPILRAHIAYIRRHLTNFGRPDDLASEVRKTVLLSLHFSSTLAVLKVVHVKGRTAS
jgi:hypothetical protein